MTVDLFNTATKKRRATELKDFTAVILVGQGKNLYPFNEGSNVVSKALLPVGGVAIINTVLNWVLESGLTDILIISHPQSYTQLSSHLTEHYSSTTYPRARISLKRDTDGEVSLDDGDDDEGVEGSARVLRSFRGFIKTDFILLPCDLSPPSSLPLAKILDKHRSSPEAVLTSVFYEPVEGVKDDDEKILVAMDKETEELLLVKPVESLEEDLSLRMSLITSHPSLSLTTSLLDAHIYVFRRTVLDLLATRQSGDLDSVREQVVPWLVKGGWQRSLGERWDKILNPPKRDPLAAALSRSTTNTTHSTPTPTYISTTSHTPLPHTMPPTPSLGGNSSGDMTTLKDGRLPTKKWKQTWKCQLLVVDAPESSSSGTGSTAVGGKGKDKKGGGPTEKDGEYLIRANTIAGYWELNRRFLRSIPPSSSITPSNSNANSISSPRPSSIASPAHATSSPSAASASASATASASGIPGQEGEMISPSAQISYDSLVGGGTRVGERASIKKSVIGRHCVIGRGAKITGCVLWDFVVVEENARLENVILCNNVRIGEKSQIKDCEFGTGFEAKAGSVIKSERLVAGQEA